MIIEFIAILSHRANVVFDKTDEYENGGICRDGSPPESTYNTERAYKTGSSSTNMEAGYFVYYLVVSVAQTDF
jgi:hypothetical protein